MGGVWGREEETEDEEENEETEEEEEEENEGEEVDKDGEVGWRGDGEGASYEDEDVNRALVVNIKEKINKLKETVRFSLTVTITSINMRLC